MVVHRCIREHRDGAKESEEDRGQSDTRSSAVRRRDHAAWTEDRRKIQQDLILALTLDNTDPLGAVGVVPQLAAQ